MREATEAQAPVNYNRSFRRMLKDTSHSLSGGKLQSRGFPVDNCWITLDRFPHSSSSHRECGKGCVIDASFVLNSRLATGTEKWITGTLLVVFVEKKHTFSHWLAHKKKKKHIRQDNGSQKQRKWFLSSCRRGWLGRMAWVGPGVEHCPLIQTPFTAHTLFTGCKDH